MDRVLSNLLTDDAYIEYRARYDRHSAFIYSLRKRGDSWISYNPEDVPENARITNEETSAIELYEFIHNPPRNYMAYISLNVSQWDTNTAYHSNRGGYITTFMGDVLGYVYSADKPIRRYTPSGGVYKVQYFRVKAYNKLHYWGIAYPSSGDYVRLYAYKDQSQFG